MSKHPTYLDYLKLRHGIEEAVHDARRAGIAPLYINRTLENNRLLREDGGVDRRRTPIGSEPGTQMLHPAIQAEIDKARDEGYRAGREAAEHDAHEAIQDAQRLAPPRRRVIALLDRHDNRIFVTDPDGEGYVTVAPGAGVGRFTPRAAVVRVDGLEVNVELGYCAPVRSDDRVKIELPVSDVPPTTRVVLVDKQSLETLGFMDLLSPPEGKT